MAKKNLKLAITAGISAVAVSVFAFGINAAFGAPSQNPPGNNVAPTFSGINLEGPITGDVESDGNIFTPTGTIAGDSLEVGQGGAEIDSNTVFHGNINLDGLNDNGDIDAAGNIIGDGLLKGEAFEIGAPPVMSFYINQGGATGTLNVLGNLLVTSDALSSIWGNLLIAGGNLNIQSPISNNAAGNSAVVINDALDVNGTIFGQDIEIAEAGAVGPILQYSPGNNPGGFPGGIFMFDASIQLDGTDYQNWINGPLRLFGGLLDIQSTIRNTSGSNPVTIDDSLVVNDPLSVNETQDVNPAGAGAFKVGTGANWIGIDQNEITSYGSDLYLNYDSGTKTRIGGGADSDLIVTGDTDIVGKLTADSIGTFTTVKSINYLQLPPNSVNGDQKTASCPANYITIGCGFSAYDWSPAESYGSYVGPGFHINNLSEFQNVCIGHYINTSNVWLYVKTQAFCFNPAI